jgi:hypothetical protein
VSETDERKIYTSEGAERGREGVRDSKSGGVCSSEEHDILFDIIITIIIIITYNNSTYK